MTGRGSPVHDIVVIGGSAGALDAMLDLMRGLPADYRGSLFMVSHIGANPSQLPELLAEAGQLPAVHPRHLQQIEAGHVYVAPPDRHLLLADGTILLSSLPREHFTRPAIDPLFRSAAHAYGPRVVGIVLSGTGSDGTAGLVAIGAAGGITVVQDPAEAAFREMPETALHAAHAHHVVAGAGLGPLLGVLADEPVVMPAPVTSDAGPGEELEVERPFALTCPECGGAIHEVGGSGILSYRCHTGHRFSANELLAHQVSDVERAVMVAIRVLQERTALCRRMIGDATAARRTYGVAYWSRLKGEAENELGVLWQFLHKATDANASEPDYAPASK
ncbi:MAG TPA: chemotaxis protein CheB [Stellaceae bacterium]|jgi:two-component system chemotaxis response regulator CheB